MLSTETSVMLIVGTGIVGIPTWLLRRTVAQLDSWRMKMEERVELLEEADRKTQDRETACAKLMAATLGDKVEKEDFLRETGRFCMKIDRLTEKLDQHEGSDTAMRDLAIEMARTIRSGANG